MKMLLAIVILGAAIAFPAAGASAAEGGCHHNFPISGPNPSATLQAGPMAPADPATAP